MGSEPRKEQYRSKKSFRIAKRRHARRQKRAEQRYQADLEQIRNKVSNPSPRNAPLAAEKPSVQTVPWA